MREGFRVKKTLRVIFERGLKKKVERRRIGGEKGWNDVVLELKQGNRSNRVFIEPDGRTAVWTGPCFFCMEWFLTLNGL